MTNYNTGEHMSRLTAWSLLIGTVLSITLVTGCILLQSATPGPGTEAVVVRKPWFFGHGGVDPTPVKTGRSWFAISSDIWYVNMMPWQYPVHFEDLMSREGVPLDFDAVIRLQVVDSVRLVETFGVYDTTAGKLTGPAWYVNNVHKQFETAVRQAVRKHGMNETAISTTAVDDIDAEVSQAMREYLKQRAIPVALLDVTVGRANPPDAVLNQRRETAAQEQRVNTEKQKKLAEDVRREAELSRAAADNAYREAMRLSPDQFIALEAIKAQHDICAKSACTFIAPGTSALVSVR